MYPKRAIALLAIGIAALASIAAGLGVYVIWTSDLEDQIVYAENPDDLIMPFSYVVPELAKFRLRHETGCTNWADDIKGPIGFSLGALDDDTDEETKARAFSVVETLLARGCQIDQYDYFGMTPLLWAVSLNYVDQANFLINHGANPDLRVHAIPRMSPRRAETVGMNALALSRYMATHSQIRLDRTALDKLLGG